MVKSTSCAYDAKNLVLDAFLCILSCRLWQIRLLRPIKERDEQEEAALIDCPSFQRAFPQTSSTAALDPKIGLIQRPEFDPFSQKTQAVLQGTAPLAKKKVMALVDQELVEREAYLADVLHEMQQGKGSARDSVLLFKKQIFSADDAEIKEARFQELCYLQVSGTPLLLCSPYS